MGLFDSLFSAAKSGMNKAAEAGIVSRFTEMSNTTIEQLENIIKMKQGTGIMSSLAMIFLNLKAGQYRTLECLRQNDILPSNANASVKRLLSMDNILLSQDPKIEHLRTIGNKFLEDIK
jgi:hypothetical protein